MDQVTLTLMWPPTTDPHPAADLVDQDGKPCRLATAGDVIEVHGRVPFVLDVPPRIERAARADGLRWPVWRVTGRYVRQNGSVR